jgi:hypothetical protein
MRAFLIIAGGLVLAAAFVLFFALSTNVVQEIESCVIGVVGAVLFGAGAIVDAVEDLRLQQVKLHDIGAIERAQRELTAKATK